jgi:DNA polymerase-1
MPSALPPPGAENVLYLIDLSGYVFRAYHAIAPLSSSKGEPTHAVMGTTNMLQKVVAEKKPHLFAVAMDSRGKTFRHEIDERYKAHRPPPPPDLSQQMARCEAIVRAFNIPVYQAEKIEADDLIATVTKRATAEGVRVVIVSADKDLMQLVHDDDDRVLLWDSMRNKVYGAPEVKEKFGVPPSQMRDLLALTGDTSDNVPGVPGVGPKTASDLLAEYKSIDGIYAGISAIKKPKLKESLITHERDARLSQQLVTLKEDVPIQWSAADLRYGGADVEKLRALFTDLEFGRQLDLLRQLETHRPADAPLQMSSPQTSLALSFSAPPQPAQPATEKITLTILSEDALSQIARDAKKTGQIAIALSVVGTEAMRAVIIGVALSTEMNRAHYVPIEHRYLGAPKQLDLKTFARVMGPIFENPKIKKLAYDMKFVEIVFARHEMKIAGPIFDASLAGYLLDPEVPNTLPDLSRRSLNAELKIYGEGAKKGSVAPFDNLPVEEATPYVAAQSEAVISLAKKYEERLDRDGLGDLMRDVELPLARVLAKMEETGVLVDIAALAAIGKEAEAELKTLEARAHELAGHEFAIRSRDQLETILFDELKLPVIKKTPKGGRSTDAEVLEELASGHPLPKTIVEYREIDKLKGTYVEALPRAVVPETGRIHTRYQQTVAATGRLSSTDPNLQNIPIRTALGRRIRSTFIAPKGSKIVSADYSQIELRVLAHLSDDPELIAAFTADEDVHVHTASLIFDVKKSDVTTDMRRQSKTINFGVIYGMGDNALARQLGIERAEAKRFIEAYFKRYAKVAQFMHDTVETAHKGEAVRTLLGRRRFLPNLSSSNRGLRAEAERVAKNTPIQGTAADILKVAMVTLGKGEVVPGAKMILTVHDELVFEIPEDKIDEASARIREAMSGAMKLKVPLRVDVGSGDNWNDAH